MQFLRYGEQENESIICVRMGQKNLSLRINICHHSPSLMMRFGGPQDCFFYPTLTLMMDSNKLSWLSSVTFVRFYSPSAILYTRLAVYYTPQNN